MDLPPAILEPKTIVVLDPTAPDGESALDLLEPRDRHVSLLVLLEGPASGRLHAAAAEAATDVLTAAEDYLAVVGERIARPGRVVEHVVARGPDPDFEVRCLRATDEVGRVLTAARTPARGATSGPLARSGSAAVRRLRTARSRSGSVLPELPLTGSIPRRELRCLERNGTVARVRDGATVLRRGSPGRQCLLVVGGRIEVRRDGRVVAELGVGDIAGEMSLLSGHVCNADVVATRDSEVFAMSRREFATVLHECPVLARHVFTTAIERFDLAA